ncbi:EI24 domain-containing protein [Shimia thalassica]|uniref:EI24 domain-containing protein n=1 Tax=Shimia thalassica TaxID=1715693 RepID=UPI002494ECC5|nr:EI24 domain-containing protein [Shimia thalassica]MDO6522594.1 EI24 domain-containing protein [Shimia thalassica]MDP2519264.1 EI24 domain-containing protein [Shimia thalassica]
MGVQLVFTAFFKSLGQLGDRRFRKVFFTGIGLALALLIGASIGLVWLLDFFLGDEVNLPWVGAVTWIDDMLSWSLVVVVPVASIFLMVPVASAMTGLFLDQVADAVEDRHYPNLPPVEDLPLSESLKDTFAFLGVMIGANILALVLYVIFSPLALFIFWALNGFLLGREYFQMAAMRRVGRDGAKELRRRHMGTIWLGGTLMAIPLSIPLVNLLIPIMGAAVFTHLFHLTQGEGTSRY